MSTKKSQVKAPVDQLTETLQTAAEIRDTLLQRKVINAVLDLQQSWRRTVEAFVAKQRESQDDSANHIDELVRSLRIQSYPEIIEVAE